MDIIIKMSGTYIFEYIYFLRSNIHNDTEKTDTRIFNSLFFLIIEFTNKINNIYTDHTDSICDCLIKAIYYFGHAGVYI